MQFAYSSAQYEFSLLSHCLWIQKQKNANRFHALGLSKKPDCLYFRKSLPLLLIFDLLRSRQLSRDFCTVATVIVFMDLFYFTRDQLHTHIHTHDGLYDIHTPICLVSTSFINIKPASYYTCNRSRAGTR